MIFPDRVFPARLRKPILRGAAVEPVAVVDAVVVRGRVVPRAVALLFSGARRIRGGTAVEGAAGPLGFTGLEVGFAALDRTAVRVAGLEVVVVPMAVAGRGTVGCFEEFPATAAAARFAIPVPRAATVEFVVADARVLRTGLEVDVDVV